MTNLTITNSKNSVLNSPSTKTLVKNTAASNPVSSFGEAIKLLQPDPTEMMIPNHPITTRTSITKIPEPVPMSPEELAAWQKNLADMAKSEKDMTEQMSPEGQKKYLMSKQVDVVARDKEGNIVAKMYKDGSWMCSNDLANNLAKCNSNAERIRLLEKNSNVMVSDYTKEKVTDFDLLKEEFAQIEKRLAIHPELRALYDPDIVELQRRTLAA